MRDMRNYDYGRFYDFDGSDPQDLINNQKDIAMIDDENVSKHFTYSSSKIEDKISEIIGFNIIIVNELPEYGEKQTLYLVPSSDGEEKNLYNEYLWIGDKWEIVGSVKVDLSNYYTIEQTDDLFNLKSNKIVLKESTNYTLDFGCVYDLGLVDGSTITLSSNGMIENECPEWHFFFTSGSNAPLWEQDITWSSTPTFTNGKRYEVSIVLINNVYDGIVLEKE